MERHDKLVLTVLSSIALVMLFVIILYNAKSSPAYADDVIVLEQISSQAVSSESSSEPQQQDADSQTQSETPASSAPPQDAQPPSKTEPPAQLWFNLNTVTHDELCLISGIGDVKASAILSFREQIGRFDSLEQLQQVKGIGEKTYQKIIQYLYVE